MILVCSKSAEIPGSVSFQLTFFPVFMYCSCAVYLYYLPVRLRDISLLSKSALESTSNERGICQNF